MAVVLTELDDSIGVGLAGDVREGSDQLLWRLTIVVGDGNGALHVASGVLELEEHDAGH